MSVKSSRFKGCRNNCKPQPQASLRVRITTPLIGQKYIDYSSSPVDKYIFLKRITKISLGQQLKGYGTVPLTWRRPIAPTTKDSPQTSELHHIYTAAFLILSPLYDDITSIIATEEIPFVGISLAQTFTPLGSMRYQAPLLIAPLTPSQQGQPDHDLKLPPYNVLPASIWNLPLTIRTHSGGRSKA